MTEPDSSGDEVGRIGLRRLASPELTPAELGAIRARMDVAFGDDEEERFTDDDWAHGLGGIHLVLDADGVIVAHASVVEREIHVAGRPLRVGYVESVATLPRHQGEGLGTRVMEAADAIIRDGFELGMLGTGSHHFYERLGWETWRGRAFIRTADGDRRTPDEEGYLLILRTPATPPIDVTSAISCDWRPGDVW